MSKSTAAKKPAITIEDACAAPACFMKPAAGSSYCAKHEGYVPPAKMTKAEVKKAQVQLAGLINAGKPETAKLVKELTSEVQADAVERERLNARMAKLKAEAKAEAKAKKVAERDAAEVAKAAKKAAKAETKTAKPIDNGETAKVMKQLYSKGWGNGSISRALGVRNQVAYGWANYGVECKRMDELKSLLALDAPAKLPRGRRTVEVEVAGNLRAPSEVAASPRVNRPLDDPRQLALALISAAAGLLNAK